MERYFDHNATTPLADAARAAWLDAAQTQWLNPSSPYRSAAAVKVRLEAARTAIAERFDVADTRVVFTAGATEANNAVIRQWAVRLPKVARIAVNPTEHPSVVEAVKAYFGERVEWLPVDTDGVVDLAQLEAMLYEGRVDAVSVMAANNVTGVLQPWPAIASLCQRFGVPYHCDASQWVGKMPLRGLAACSYVTACAHKFGGPKGVGCMLLPDGDTGLSILSGGSQENGHRAGTEDVAAILAMRAALDAIVPGDPQLRDVFIGSVRAKIPGVKILGEGAPRLWNTVLMLMPKYPSARWIRLLEKSGFLVSAGSACSTGRSGVSPVLAAMGVDAVAAGRALRISSGADTTGADWAALADAIANGCAILARESAGAESTVISVD